MKYFKISAIVLLGAITLLFLYANTRAISPTEKLPRIALATFTLNKVDHANLLTERLKNLDGVTACRVSNDYDIVSITYQPNKLSPDQLKARINDAGAFEASLKVFETKAGGCPVHKVGNSFTKLISTLDLRNLNQ